MPTKPEAPDIKNMDAIELYENCKSLVAQMAGMKAKAGAPHTTARYRAAQWAGVRDVESRLAAYDHEILRRLGVDLSKAPLTRPGMIAIAISKHERRCLKCQSTGGVKGRWLNWYTKEGTPMPLLVASTGGTKEQVRAHIKNCTLLCIKCAAKLGVKFTDKGQPDLKEFLTTK